MLAVMGRPFDSETHFFEYKWDGFRAAAMIEDRKVRLMSRNSLDLADQYPGLSVLGALPRGLALDGELVAFSDGKPDFDLMLSRGRAARSDAVKYVVFDVLYEDFDSRMDLPFIERRQILERIVKTHGMPQLILSEGAPAKGLALYQKACDQGLEGVVAKRLAGAYASGKRNGSWVKIKRRLRINAVIIGYIEKEGSDFQCLLVASNGLPGEEGGPLRFVGRVGGGFTQAARSRINALLREHPRRSPVVACAEKGSWVEPGLYCAVSFAELTAAGLLRAPVFEGLIDS
jgi:bifunctional non-homologous end joining protein LigD